MAESSPATFADLATEEIAHLNPVYWDGHTIGYGRAEPLPVIRAGTALLRRALDEMQLHEATAVGDHPLQTYRPGDTFDSASHRPGTILQIEQEHLEPIAALHLAEDIDQFRGQPLPVREEVLERDEASFFVSPRLSYVHELCLAVVMRNWRRPALVENTTRARYIPGGVLLGTGIAPSPPVREIGQTSHYRKLRGERLEVLTRTLKIDILAHGLPARPARSIFSLGSIAARHRTTGAG